MEFPFIILFIILEYLFFLGFFFFFFKKKKKKKNIQNSVFFQFLSIHAQFISNYLFTTTFK